MLIKSKKIEYVEKQTDALSGFVQADYIPAETKKTSSSATRKNHNEELENKIRIAEQEAFDRGLAEGMIRGSDVEKKKLLTAVTAFEKALHDISSLRNGIFENLEPEILGLAVTIAEKIIHQETKTDKNVYLSVLKEAVRNILDKEGMKIRLHPLDYEHMLEVNPAFLNSFEGVKNPSLEKDDTLSRGDVVIETMFGEVDARLGRQLEEITTAFSRKG